MKTRGLPRMGLALLLLTAVLAAGFGGAASARADDGDWLGEYYDNRWLDGSPALVREDDAIDFDWGDGSPDDAIPSDDFSVRWTRTVDVDEGTYRFTTTSDDGVRLYVDRDLLIDSWYDMRGDDNSARVDLSAGTHTLRLEYYEHEGDASVQLSWGQVDDDTPVGNIITCVRPSDSWIKVYRWDGSSRVDVKPEGYEPLSASGYLKLDGMLVDTDTYGGNGHPYRVELWAGGSLIAAVGDTAAGQSEFRVYANTDNITPWSCAAP
jgi:hypothetical protein